MKRIPKGGVIKWINALRSGKFVQGKGKLEAENGKYCCLGVACKIFIPKGKLRMEGSLLFGALPDDYDQPNAPEWVKIVNYDFERKTNKELSVLNDDEDFSFDEIADLLQLCYIEKAKFQ